MDGTSGVGGSKVDPGRQYVMGREGINCPTHIMARLLDPVYCIIFFLLFPAHQIGPGTVQRIITAFLLFPSAFLFPSSAFSPGRGLGSRERRKRSAGRGCCIDLSPRMPQKEDLADPFCLYYLRYLESLIKARRRRENPTQVLFSAFPGSDMKRI